MRRTAYMAKTALNRWKSREICLKTNRNYYNSIVKKFLLI
ncbi:hypothetical protein EVA_15429 [gut metagenome]|uniref:Uncharacterized protein n=1 Tax=gut metagenome TaxID=749906 RepID=J9C989_9ZZZZ